ncbi:MAG TPA: hypothetical protein VJB88_13920 [Vicinamibacteria bacterium]|nr:hypothetical protein [Vicinamibacteria bacterium]
MVLGMRGMHRMNGAPGQAETSDERKADRRRSLRLWVLMGVLTLALTALAMIAPSPLG